MTDIKALLEESELEFAKVVALLEMGDTKLAKVIAWRMASRLEEARLRHPVI